MHATDPNIMKSLQGYVGRAYVPGVFDCADLAVLVQREVFGRTVTLPLQRHPGGVAGQRAAILALRSAVASRVDVPCTGCAALFTELNDKGDHQYHIGTVALHRGDVWVLHNSFAQGSVALNRLVDLQAQGMKLEGWYAWT
jgi:hypothetical protein